MELASVKVVEKGLVGGILVLGMRWFLKLENIDWGVSAIKVNRVADDGCQVFSTH